MLRWFRERGCVHCLARDAGISQATGYRYLHEGIDVLADQGPDLHEVLNRCQQEGMTHVILDGTLIASDRVAGVRANGNDLWFSQKHKAFGGNIQFLSAPDGTPLWVSDVEPGSTPDIGQELARISHHQHEAANARFMVFQALAAVGKALTGLVHARRRPTRLRRTGGGPRDSAVGGNLLAFVQDQ